MVSSALLCLALNVYFEARQEPLDGQLAVAHVVLNRARSARFPDTVCDVVRQGGEIRYRCQFTWYCDGKPDTPYEPEAWQRAQFVAALAWCSRPRRELRDALFYHATWVTPDWAEHMRPVAVIGDHIFYED